MLSNILMTEKDILATQLRIIAEDLDNLSNAPSKEQVEGLFRDLRSVFHEYKEWSRNIT